MDPMCVETNLESFLTMQFRIGLNNCSSKKISHFTIVLLIMKQIFWFVHMFCNLFYLLLETRDLILYVLYRQDGIRILNTTKNSDVSLKKI